MLTLRDYLINVLLKWCMLSYVHECKLCNLVRFYAKVVSNYCKRERFGWGKLSWLSWFFRRAQSFFHESFALSTTYKHPGLAP